MATTKKYVFSEATNPLVEVFGIYENDPDGTLPRIKFESIHDFARNYNLPLKTTLMQKTSLKYHQTSSIPNMKFWRADEDHLIEKQPFRKVLLKAVNSKTKEVLCFDSYDELVAHFGFKGRKQTLVTGVNNAEIKNKNALDNNLPAKYFYRNKEEELKPWELSKRNF